MPLCSSLFPPTPGIVGRTIPVPSDEHMCSDAARALGLVLRTSVVFGCASLRCRCVRRFSHPPRVSWGERYPSQATNTCAQTPHGLWGWCCAPALCSAAPHSYLDPPTPGIVGRTIPVPFGEPRERLAHDRIVNDAHARKLIVRFAHPPPKQRPALSFFYFVTPYVN